MPYEAIQATLSPSRFSTYRKAIEESTGDDCLQSALNLYQWNAELSSRFFFPLHVYEIVLRNAISDAITMRYGDNWPTNQYFLNSLNFQDRRTLENAMRNGYESVGKVLPEIKFVWYENLLTARHDYRIWDRYIMTIFPNSPDMTSAELRSRLKAACYTIRRFRNRCGHHEPIFNNSTLNDILPLMTETIKWRCSDTNEWMVSQETVSELLSNPVI
ncbi:conserved hypothetical protein [Vibrio chagasii]|nr:conserved hypothetical protein [Vibrio chagasii]CAH6965322.1 conserved hypothetical protein [Vibrio chagasii]